MHLETLAYWHHNFEPFLVRFTDNIGIRYYGLAYVCGFVVSWWFLTRYAKASLSEVAVEKVWDLILVMVAGVMVGGRVGHYLLYDGWKRFELDPFEIFRVWEGGMAFHGGLLGVGAAIWIYSYFTKIRFTHLSDLMASVASIGLLFGRLANFINGELWGKATTVPWAMYFPQSPAPLVPRHPSQLYEAVLEGLVLLVFTQWRFWRSSVTKLHPGQLAGEYILAYAAARSFCELYREPDASLVPFLGQSLSRGTFYSLAMVGIGLAFLIHARRTKTSDQ
jgi:phosphatidylglycerol:prolipoprotein diacylglycerol transferase